MLKLMFMSNVMSNGDFRGAHASRLLVVASRCDEISKRVYFRESNPQMGRKVRFGETPKPARETRALPGRSGPCPIAIRK
jgi:hypothetical protein